MPSIWYATIMGFFEGFRRKVQKSADRVTQEKPKDFDDTREKSFQEYSDYFSLTKEDLQKSLLDIGSGDGAFVQYLREVLGNNQAYGVEKQSQKINPSQEGMIAGNGLFLPFKDETFEIVIAKDYFPIFVANEENMQQTISEALRVLKQGGKMIGNISIPEKEIEAKDYWVPQVKDDEARKRANINFGNRYEGAKKLETFLRGLEENGYEVDYREDKEKNGKVIIVVQKL